MKTRKTLTLATQTKKAFCALLTPCILLSSCQKSAEDSPQDLTQSSEKLTSTPQSTPSPVPTPTAALGSPGSGIYLYRKRTARRSVDE